MNTATVYGGPLDGKPLLRFPEDGAWHRGADGWPLALEPDGEPTVAPAAPTTERYFPVSWPGLQGPELFYVWHPVLAAWYEGRAKAS